VPWRREVFDGDVRGPGDTGAHCGQISSVGPHVCTAQHSRPCPDAAAVDVATAADFQHVNCLTPNRCTVYQLTKHGRQSCEGAD
jgi:hypothetical protein